MEKSLYYISPIGTVQLTNKKYQNSLDFEHVGEIDNSKRYFLIKMSLGQKMGKGSIFVFFFIAIPLQHERSIEIRKKTQPHTCICITCNIISIPLPNKE